MLVPQRASEDRTGGQGPRDSQRHRDQRGLPNRLLNRAVITESLQNLFPGKYTPITLARKSLPTETNKNLRSFWPGKMQQRMDISLVERGGVDAESSWGNSSLTSSFTELPVSKKTTSLSACPPLPGAKAEGFVLCIGAGGSLFRL